MQMLIWGGTVVVLLGLAGLIWCMIKVAAAKRENLDDAALRDRIAAILPVNLGSLFICAIGLMLVVVGIALG